MSKWDVRARNRELNTKILSDHGFNFQSFNNGTHLRINTVDFYPGTSLWKDINGKSDYGVESLIKYLNKESSESLFPATNKASVNQLSVEQIFDIAKSSKDRSLYGICESIHKEIYK